MTGEELGERVYQDIPAPWECPKCWPERVTLPVGPFDCPECDYSP